MVPYASDWSPDGGGADKFMAFFADERFPLRAGNYNTSGFQMVAGKMGTTLVPAMALDQLISNSSELRAVHLNEAGPHRKIAFITRPNFSGVANIQILMDLFSKQLRDTNSGNQ